MQKVKTAVIGCGMISNIYIRNLMHLFSIVDLVALCDINRSSADEKAALYGIDKVMSLEELEKTEEIEMVINLTGPSAHYDVIKRMLLAGKHVFTEKMLTNDLEQGRELVALANEKKLYLGVAPDTILGAGIQTARKVIDSGMIGTVTSCMVSINRNQSLNSEIYTFIRKPGGAFPYDVGVYHIAALLTLLGPVRAVTGFAGAAPKHRGQLLYKGNEDSWQIPGNNLVTGALEFENGTLASIHFNGNTINEPQEVFIIYGTEGILKLGSPNSFGGQVRLLRTEGEECVIPHTHGYNGAVVLDNPTPYELQYGHRGVGAAEMAWSIRAGRSNRCSKELGLHTMEVLCGLDDAAKNKSVYEIMSTFEMRPLPSGYLSTMFHGKMRSDAECSLID